VNPKAAGAEMDPAWADRARRELVELATSYVGCGMTTDPEQYQALIADGETPERAAEMARESGCGLVVRGLWRSWGCADLRLEAPYHDTKAIEDLVAMAREAGAWRSGHLDELGPGDAVVLEGPEHILTVVGVRYGFVHSVDGGQRDDAGLECIKSESRKLEWPGGKHLDTRPVLGWISWPQLAWHFLGRREEL
jgi:hypothetical protein